MAADVAEESAWFKSSYSNDTGGACVEIADLSGQIGIRDSKDKAGPALAFTPVAWAGFIGFVNSRDGEFDLS
ncbi:DUF397 domain-containing protein [Streptomyces noursei]|uniref:DUF397 domain-containing protein n=1 Tax=Streptomyces noursei TaxID=1971 RepID=UPI00382252F7